MATAQLARNGYRIAKSWQYREPLPEMTARENEAATANNSISEVDSSSYNVRLTGFSSPTVENRPLLPQLHPQAPPGHQGSSSQMVLKKQKIEQALMKRYTSSPCHLYRSMFVTYKYVLKN